MRDRGFLNYRRKEIPKPTKLRFSDRLTRYYQISNAGTFMFVASRGKKIKNTHREPLIKLARRQLKKRSNIVVSSTPNGLYTSKPLGVRMGKGKGKVEGSVLIARPGQKLLTFIEVNKIRISKLYNSLRYRSSIKLVQSTF